VVRRTKKQQHISIMENFIFFILAVWGCTHILVSSKILAPLRDWLLISSPFLGELFNCYQCTSFWVSILCFPWFEKLPKLTTHFQSLNFDFLAYGFVGSGIISFFSVFLSLLIKFSRRDI